MVSAQCHGKFRCAGACARQVRNLLLAGCADRTARVPMSLWSMSCRARVTGRGKPAPIESKTGRLGHRAGCPRLTRVAITRVQTETRPLKTARNPTRRRLLGNSKQTTRCGKFSWRCKQNTECSSMETVPKRSCRQWTRRNQHSWLRKDNSYPCKAGSENRNTMCSASPQTFTGCSA